MKRNMAATELARDARFNRLTVEETLLEPRNRNNGIVDSRQSSGRRPFGCFRCNRVAVHLPGFSKAV